MIDLHIGFTFRFKRDKSKDALVNEHEAELKQLKEAKRGILAKLLDRCSCKSD